MSDQNQPDVTEQIRELQLRTEMLERENQRLREHLGSSYGPPNPNFNAPEFRRAMSRINLKLGFATGAVYILIGLLGVLRVTHHGWMPVPSHIGTVRVFDFAGTSGGIPGMGLGIIAVGGGALGVVAVGGFAIGLFAFGGGAFGVVACGGGAVGIFSYGGGTLGFIAIGGGACGYYALATQRGAGKFVLALNRQDPQAIELFQRWFPALRPSVTNPMPVIPLARRD